VIRADLVATCSLVSPAHHAILCVACAAVFSRAGLVALFTCGVVENTVSQLTLFIPDPTTIERSWPLYGLLDSMLQPNVVPYQNVQIRWRFIPTALSPSPRCSMRYAHEPADHIEHWYRTKNDLLVTPDLVPFRKRFQWNEPCHRGLPRTSSIRLFAELMLLPWQ
jgi:hypothetical protein